MEVLDKDKILNMAGSCYFMGIGWSWLNTSSHRMLSVVEGVRSAGTGAIRTGEARDPERT